MELKEQIFYQPLHSKTSPMIGQIGERKEIEIRCHAVQKIASKNLLMIFPRKSVEGLLLCFGFMALGGFEVERGLIAEGRVESGSVVEAFDVVENHEVGLLSGFGDF